jgi:hypothetical protein
MLYYIEGAPMVGGTYEILYSLIYSIRFGMIILEEAAYIMILSV